MIAIYVLFVVQLTLADSDRAAEDVHYRCGVHAVYLLTHFTTALKPTVAAVDELLPRHADGENSLAELADVVKSLGAHPLTFFSDERDLRQLPIPCIVHLKSSLGNSKASHFSVLVRVLESDAGIILADAPAPCIRITRSQFVDEWSGHAMAVFPTKEQLDSYVGDRRRTLEYFQRIQFTVLLAMAISASLSVWSLFRRIRPNTCSLLFSLMVLWAVGCNQSVTSALSVQNTDIDGGLVPPEGKTVEIPVTNQSSRDITLGRIITSCGCTSLEAPAIVRRGMVAKLTLKLEGSHTPNMRRSLVVVNCENRPPLMLNVTYATGIIPAMTREILSVSQSKETLPYGEFGLWVYASSAPSRLCFSRHCVGGNEWQIHVLNRNVTTMQESETIEINETGLHLVRLSLKSNQRIEDGTPRQLSLSYLQDEKESIIPFTVCVDDPHRLVVRPSRLLIPTRQAIGTSGPRTIVVNSPINGTCRILEVSNGVTARIAAMGVGSWRVDVDVVSALQIPKEGEIVFEWSDETNRTIARCPIEYVPKYD